MATGSGNGEGAGRLVEVAMPKFPKRGKLCTPLSGFRSLRKNELRDRKRHVKLFYLTRIVYPRCVKQGLIKGVEA